MAQTVGDGGAQEQGGRVPERHDRPKCPRDGLCGGGVRLVIQRPQTGVDEGADAELVADHQAGDDDGDCLQYD